MDVHFGRVLSSRFGHEGASLADLHMDVRFGKRGLASPADLDMDVHFGQRASPADLDMDVHFGQREFCSRCAQR